MESDLISAIYPLLFPSSNYVLPVIEIVTCGPVVEVCGLFVCFALLCFKSGLPGERDAICVWVLRPQQAMLGAAGPDLCCAGTS